MRKRNLAVNCPSSADKMTVLIILMKYLFILPALLLLASAAPEADLVDLLIPGYVNHKFYSGFLDFNTATFHYVFFDSQTDPDNDPLVLWLNGGPGCSSLLGMAYENGPFVFKQGTVNFQINPYAWNMKANLLYISSPAGVGFSVSKTGSLASNDTSSAQDNYKALIAFFNKFPNLKKNDFYITGESYAGIYGPWLANEIVKRNKLPTTQTKIKLKGVMINNACTDPRECYEPGNDVNLGIYQYENLFVHGYYTENEYDSIKGACTLGYKSPGCVDIRKTMDAKFYNTNTSMLNLYAKCLYQKTSDAAQARGYQRIAHGKAPTMADGVICEDMYGISHFFNQLNIQVKFHLPYAKFQPCSDAVGNLYKMDERASYWLYPVLMKQGIRLWVTSGDVDNSVPVTGTVRWITKLRDEFGIPIEEQWREWWVPGIHKHEDQVGGMVWKLRGLTFASVKGAGHMMPKDKKREASVLLKAFLNGENLPENPN